MVLEEKHYPYWKVVNHQLDYSSSQVSAGVLQCTIACVVDPASSTDEQ